MRERNFVRVVTGGRRTTAAAAPLALAGGNSGAADGDRRRRDGDELASRGDRTQVQFLVVTKWAEKGPAQERDDTGRAAPAHVPGKQHKHGPWGCERGRAWRVLHTLASCHPPCLFEIREILRSLLHQNFNHLVFLVQFFNFNINTEATKFYIRKCDIFRYLIKCCKITLEIKLTPSAPK